MADDITLEQDIEDVLGMATTAEADILDTPPEASSPDPEDEEEDEGSDGDGDGEDDE